MAKDLHIGFLLDFYGSLLPTKQRILMDYYYNDDLSLSEISELIGMTRQGVRDSIKRAENALNEAENRLGMMERFGKVNLQIDEIRSAVRAMEQAGLDADPAARIQLKRIKQATDGISQIGPEVI